MTITVIDRSTPGTRPQGGPALRRILFISYYFPPESSSGVHRALNFVRHLPSRGWLPTVLTAAPHRYSADSVLDPDLLNRVPAGVTVVRTGGPQILPRRAAQNVEDRREGLAAKRRWPFNGLRRVKQLQQVNVLVRGWLALPDDKIGWLPWAVVRGWCALRATRHEAIVVTGGPWTAFVVGWMLARLTRLPLVLDYRDPWTANPHGPARPEQRRRIEATIERRIMRAASAIVANTAELRDLLVAMAPDVAPARFVTITNGFDPEMLASVRETPRARGRSTTFVHTGHVYRHRSPEGLFRALAELRSSGELRDESVQILFVGDSDIDLTALANRYEVGSIVQVRPHVSHRESLELLRTTDVVLLIQTGTQLQVPAKVYEYIGAGKPILALTDSKAIARLIREMRLGAVCLPSDTASIRSALRQSLERSAGPFDVAPEASRRFRADAIVDQLTAVLNGVTVVDRGSGQHADGTLGVAGGAPVFTDSRRGLR